MVEAGIPGLQLAAQDVMGAAVALSAVEGKIGFSRQELYYNGVEDGGLSDLAHEAAMIRNSLNELHRKLTVSIGVIQTMEAPNGQRRRS